MKKENILDRIELIIIFLFGGVALIMIVKRLWLIAIKYNYITINYVSGDVRGYISTITLTGLSLLGGVALLYALSKKRNLY